MPKKIVIVDDQPHLRLLIAQCLEELEDEGVALLLAADGEAGLALIRQERPDLVLLDVMMPKLNGFEVCEQLRADPSTAGAHVILLTAKGQEGDHLRGREVGANAYVTKPFNPDELLERVRRVIGLEAP